MRNQIPHHPYRTTHDDIESNDSSEDDENPHHSFPRNAGHFYNFDDESSKRHPKKRKLESFVSNHDQFNPARSGPTMWTEEESFVLLEVWGERYLELGRRSLRAEDWADVVDKVFEMSGVERSEMQCRNQLDVLKNKYKKERAKVESGHLSKWVFFKKMDVLLNMRMRGGHGLGCGLDSGEYVFMNPRVYLDRSNLLDEMRDSPGQSDEEGDDDDGEEEREVGRERDRERERESARLLAESIQKFGEIYEKIEESKRRQMIELEKMRQEFERELEVQKKQVVELAEAEIAKIREMDNEDSDDDSSEEDDEDNENGDNTDVSAENLRD